MQKDFFLHSSHLLTAYILVGHVVVSAALIFSSFPLRWLMLGILLLSSTYYLLRDAWLVLGESWVKFKLDEGHVTLTNRAGGTVTGSLMRESVVTPHFVTLNVTGDNWRGRVRLLVMQDCMEENAFRQLRVMMKWKAGK